MKMLRKRFDCESYGNSQENISGGVCFSKATRLQCRDRISTISRRYNRFFLEDVPKY